jgi:hypothetical protein
LFIPIDFGALVFNEGHRASHCDTRLRSVRLR